MHVISESGEVNLNRLQSGNRRREASRGREVRSKGRGKCAACVSHAPAETARRRRGPASSYANGAASASRPAVDARLDVSAERFAAFGKVKRCAKSIFSVGAYRTSRATRRSREARRR